MSDEIEVEEVKEPRLRSSKADITKYIARILDLIAQNTQRAEAMKLLKDEFGIKNAQAQRYFNQATDQLESDLADKTKTIRDRRIHALNKDVKESYRHYKDEVDPKYKIQWFEVYQKAKNQLDTFYANKLAPEVEREDTKIEIIFQPATTNRNSNDSD